MRYDSRDNSRAKKKSVPVRLAAARRRPKQPCLRMSAVSADYRPLVRAKCVKCRNGSGECLLGLFDQALRDLAN
jgi:hypothetical protein